MPLFNLDNEDEPEKNDGSDDDEDNNEDDEEYSYKTMKIVHKL